MTLLPEPLLEKAEVLPGANRLSANVFPLPSDLMPVTEFVPSSLETIILFDAPAWIPVPLLSQVLFAMTLSLPPEISIPVTLLMQTLFAATAQAHDSQMPWPLL